MTTPSNKKPVKFLVCIDTREECWAALRLACMKALVRNGAVDMLHVIPPGDFQTLGTIADRMREEQRAEGEKLLNKLANDVATTYGLAPGKLLREGTPGEEIIAVAKSDSSIITVVLGIAQDHAGRGKLASWLAGQLGGKLFTPLLMVPGKLTDEQLQQLV